MLRRLSFSLALLIGLGTGCYSDIESFSDRAAKLECVRLEECNKSYFENEYGGDMDECRDEVARSTENALEVADLRCEYDSEDGRDCIHEMRKNKKECGKNADEDIRDVCLAVYCF